MLWRGREGSENIEDRRGLGGGLAVGGGIGGIIIAILYALLGGGTSTEPELLPGQKPAHNQPYEAITDNDEDTLAQFVSVVLNDTETVWDSILPTYKYPKLVLFSNAVQSACGSANSAVGPFYCPGDSKIYIDLSFFNQLKKQFGVSGDFAMAYVVAHEVGHHIQNIMGTAQKVHRMKQNVNEKEGNALSVRLELQADFLAGVWAHHANRLNSILEPGDIAEALEAANAIGDDKLQMRSQGYVVPDAFTHGTSEERMYWFKRGYETGDLQKGNTFEQL